MLEATSWHDKVFPAAKPGPDLKTWVLAAGLSSRWDLPPKLQHPKGRRKGHVREQAVPKHRAGHSSKQTWEQQRREGDDGALWKIVTRDSRILVWALGYHQW